MQAYEVQSIENRFGVDARKFEIMTHPSQGQQVIDKKADGGSGARFQIQIDFFPGERTGSLLTNL